MIRVCPHSDSKCVHGMSCAYTCATDAYDGNKNLCAEQNEDRAASTPVGGWPADDQLHDAIRQLRQHMTTIQAAKQASAAGQPQGMGPIWNLVNALPAIVRQLDAAELDIEAAFEQYEDRAPAPASDTTSMEAGT